MTLAGQLDAYMNKIRNELWFKDEMKTAIERLSKEMPDNMVIQRLQREIIGRDAGVGDA